MTADLRLVADPFAETRRRLRAERDAIEHRQWDDQQRLRAIRIELDNLPTEGSDQP